VNSPSRGIEGEDEKELRSGALEADPLSLRFCGSSLLILSSGKRAKQMMRGGIPQ
jgi:hypothetical protein